MKERKIVGWGMELGEKEELVIGMGVAWDDRIVYIGGVLCAGLAIVSTNQSMKNLRIIFNEYRNRFSSTENIIDS